MVLSVVLAMLVGMPASALAAGFDKTKNVWTPPNTPLGNGTPVVKGGLLKVAPLPKATTSSSTPPSSRPLASPVLPR